MNGRPKDDGPETVAQALRWQVVNSRYVRLGLCYRCAAQAEYGHQLGWSRIHPPCAACVPVVATFPWPAGGPWRKTLGAGDTRARAAREGSAVAS